MRTGIVLITPGKKRFWYPCADADTGLNEMAAAHAGDNRFGKAWGHPATVIEFGTDDGKTFTSTRVLKAAESANAG